MTEYLQNSIRFYIQNSTNNASDWASHSALFVFQTSSRLGIGVAGRCGESSRERERESPNPRLVCEGPAEPSDTSSGHISAQTYSNNTDNSGSGDGRGGKVKKSR